MSRLGDVLDRFAAGDVDWPTTLDRLVSWRYGTTARSKAPRPPTADAVFARGEDETFHDAGTWDEVRRARDRGVLSGEQYAELIAAREG